MNTPIADELHGIDLGDARLNRRSKHLLEALAANPEASINAACDGWGDTVAAYRFLDNPAVTPAEILRPHRQATVQRLRSHPRVLLVQDTTELDLTRHPPKDAGCLNQPDRFGLYAHVHLAVTPDRVILGVVGLDSFDRPPESLGKADERATLPIEQKESFRWLEGDRLACQVAAEAPGTRIISVADREADLYDIFVEAGDGSAQPRADFVIRARVDRCTRRPNPSAGPAAYHKVRDEVGRSALRATRVLELAATPQRAARVATLEVRTLEVDLKPPHQRSHLPSVRLNVVLVEEVGGPGDGTDVSWLLITSLPVTTVEEALEVIDSYVARWAVEVYFRTWKTGCRVEQIRLETRARVRNCLAFYAIIAWRVMYVTYLSRTTPSAPCTVVFTPNEWQSVWRVVRREPLPTSPPSVSEMLRLVSRLGGYNNRAKESPPGPQSIWVGLRRMGDFAIAWECFAAGG